MRRKDRQMDKEFGLKLIDAASYGIVSMIAPEGKPYGLPLSLVRDGNTLYFHAAKEGKKLASLKNNPAVWITFVGQVEVPELYDQDQLEGMKEDPTKASLFISSVFTTEFESAMVSGRVKKVEKDKEKIKAMKLICEKYTPSKMAFLFVFCA